MSNDNNFNSIEKMMEFGMSMAVAQQMMQTMNHAMSQMQTPQFNNVNMPVPAPKQFYALVNDIPQGPFTESELTGHIVAGRVQKTTMVWLQGIPSWMPAEQVLDENKLFGFVHQNITLFICMYCVSIILHFVARLDFKAQFSYNNAINTNCT
jgi:hypothetical protein